MAEPAIVEPNTGPVVLTRNAGHIRVLTVNRPAKLTAPATELAARQAFRAR